MYMAVGGIGGRRSWLIDNEAQRLAVEAAGKLAMRPVFVAFAAIILGGLSIVTTRHLLAGLVVPGGFVALPILTMAANRKLRATAVAIGLREGQPGSKR